MQKDNIVWANGEFLELEAVPLIPFYRGLQFGDGLFETIRADHGKIHFLPEHLSRLTISCQALNIPTPDFSNYEKTIGRLLELNRLHTKTARIKILLSRGFSGQIGLPKTKETACLITASRYSSPTAEDMAKGINLISYSSDFPNNLANHKSLNYLFNLVARQYANSLGYDEAILIDRDLNISETSTGSLLFSDSEGWLTPESFFQLPGITISQVKKLLASEQQGVRVQNITINSLNNIDKAFVINSLTGLIPVKRINEMSLREVDSDYAEQINSALFS